MVWADRLVGPRQVSGYHQRGRIRLSSQRGRVVLACPSDPRQPALERGWPLARLPGCSRMGLAAKPSLRMVII